MAKINAIGSSSGSLTVDPGASGDSFIQFDINTTGEFIIGVDDTDSDKFKLSQGSALGTTDTFEVTEDGERTMVLQPAFLGVIASNDDNITGDGTEYTFGTNVAYTEAFDQGGDFNTNGTFTAPTTGVYRFNATFRMRHFLAAMTSSQLKLSTSNRDYISDFCNIYFLRSSFDQYYVKIQAIVDMDASDTAVMKVKVSGSTKTADLGGAAIAYPIAYFAGELIC